MTVTMTGTLHVHVDTVAEFDDCVASAQGNPALTPVEVDRASLTLRYSLSQSVE